MIINFEKKKTRTIGNSDSDLIVSLSKDEKNVYFRFEPSIANIISITGHVVPSYDMDNKRLYFVPSENSKGYKISYNKSSKPKIIATLKGINEILKYTVGEYSIRRDVQKEMYYIEVNIHHDTINTILNKCNFTNSTQKEETSSISDERKHKVLSFIAKQRSLKMPISKLSNEIGYSTTITRNVVEKLVSDGYVLKEISKDHRYAACTYKITELGKSYLQVNVYD